MSPECRLAALVRRSVTVDCAELVARRRVFACTGVDAVGSADRREGVLSESNGLSGAGEAAASGRMGRHGTQVAVVARQ